MAAGVESERGMRVCNEWSGMETDLYTMLSRPRAHVEHTGMSHNAEGSGEWHQVK